jgi:hypothetical protein
MNNDIPQTSNSRTTSNSEEKGMFGFGMFLGAMLGLLSGVISVRLSFEMGKPDALIRAGWDYCHVATMVIFGIMAGTAYGSILTLLTKAFKKKVPQKPLFVMTFFWAAAVYIITEYFAVTYRDADISLCGDLIVFLGSLGIAILLLRRKGQDTSI